MAKVMTVPCEEQIIERQSLCLPGLLPGIAIHAGEAGFKADLDKHFLRSENNTAEKLVELKAELRTLSTEAFWDRLMEGLASLCHAQFGFVSKRILVDDHESAVEMPRIGEVGSCLMGVAIYWNDGKEMKNMLHDYKYYAWSAPCSYMRYDKVFLAPEGLSNLVKENPNQVPFECDAYLGLPLFADGKCFAHFGLMWTKEGLELKKNLSWGYLEMLMHTFEDMITERLISGQGFAKINNKNKPRGTSETPSGTARVIPKEVVTSAQSLKPYAKSLSHELRTPMHGVVGMLDIMYATVQEQIEEQASNKVRSVFQMLKDNIEVVQDSSKRAVEAADNVVYAYDLNMQIPDTPSHETTTPSTTQQSYFDSRPKMTEGSNILNPHKRRRSSPSGWTFGNATKIRQVDGQDKQKESELPQSPLTGFKESVKMSAKQPMISMPELDAPFEFPRPHMLTPGEPEINTTLGARQSNIRELLPVVIHEALRVGGRPDSAISEPTPLGERIEVRSRSSSGYTSQKIVEWIVESDVPDLVALDERDLSKLISAVFLNAIKFTENGTIRIHSRMSLGKRHVLISIVDTGSGIPEGFQPELFKPFAKEDHSITRSKEGLGLGLLVAKGLARRAGGDLVLLRSSTEGPDRGTEFEIRVPIEQGERLSRSSTPFGNTPDRNIPRSAPHIPFVPDSPKAMEEYLSPAVEPASPSRNGTRCTPTISKLSAQISTDDRRSSIDRRISITPAVTSLVHQESWDKKLAEKFPLRFLVAEDNKINRKLLVNMLSKLGYKNTYEAFDGREAVRIVDGLLTSQTNNNTEKNIRTTNGLPLDVILMDLWMPVMDGYEATEKILAMYESGTHGPAPIVLAVSADVTEQAVDRATMTGMQGYMTKPYRLVDLQRLILEFCASRAP